MTGFIDVLLRGLILAAQATTVGGIVFALAVLRGVGAQRVLAVTMAGAATLALAQAGQLTVQLVALADPTGWPLAEVARTLFFRVGVARIVMALVVIAIALRLRRVSASGAGARGWWIALVAGALGLGVAAGFTSHAAARLARRPLLLALDATHQLAAATWIGGLLCLVVTGLSPRARAARGLLLARFSALALSAVALLLASALALSLHYVDGWRALAGTAYGLMVLTKVTIFVGLVLFGAANFRAVRRLDAGADAAPPRLRRFVEVELGLGLTVLFVAASLTSLPPAVDVTGIERATPSEVATRFTPRPPRFSSPRHEELPAGDRAAPRTDEDRAWSEYNHHMAGLFVVTMGLLALVSRTRWGRWARHWPLVFLGLAAFLLVRNDPGSWPLGPETFWEGMRHPEAVQHRIFVLLVVVFGIFEWAVRTGRVRAPVCRFIFPILCAVGGGLLLTHSHAGFSLKAEFLIEVTHAPLGLLGMIVGWGRWLELRLPPPADRLPGRAWAWAFTLVGVLLLLYRES